MQNNAANAKPSVNRRKTVLYAPIKLIRVVDDEVTDPTVIDQLLDFNRKQVAMEKAAQSPGGSPKDLPRLRGRSKVTPKDEKKTTKNDTPTSKVETNSDKKSAKRSLRSNAALQETGKVKLRSSLKLNPDTASKKLTPNKKVLKKVVKKVKKSVTEEKGSLLRNGKRKRKAQSPIFSEKDNLKKKVKRLIEDSSSSTCSTPVLEISKSDDTESEYAISICEKVKNKRSSVESRSGVEDKDSEDVVKKEAEMAKVASSLMKVRNRKKKSRSIEKTSGNIWAVDSNGSELVISDTASTNTSRRSSFNSITSENNSNSQDVKLEQAVCGEQTIPPLHSLFTVLEEEKKSEQLNELTPQVKTQLIVPFSINNKPVLKTGNKIKRLNPFIDDTTDNTDSDALANDTDTCATDDEEASVFKPKALNASNENSKSDHLKVEEKTLVAEKSNAIDENNVDKKTSNEETTSTDTTAESEPLVVIKSPNEPTTQIEPKTIAEAQPCDSKDNNVNELSNDKSVEIPSDALLHKENRTDSKQTLVSNAQCTVQTDDVSVNDPVPNNTSCQKSDLEIVKEDESEIKSPDVVENDIPEELIDEINEILNESDEKERSLSESDHNKKDIVDCNDGIVSECNDIMAESNGGAKSVAGLHGTVEDMSESNGTVKDNAESDDSVKGFTESNNIENSVTKFNETTENNASNDIGKEITELNDSETGIPESNDEEKPITEFNDIATDITVSNNTVKVITESSETTKDKTESIDTEKDIAKWNNTAIGMAELKDTDQVMSEYKDIAKPDDSGKVKVASNESAKDVAECNDIDKVIDESVVNENGPKDEANVINHSTVSEKFTDDTQDVEMKSVSETEKTDKASDSSLGKNRAESSEETKCNIEEASKNMGVDIVESSESEDITVLSDDEQSTEDSDEADPVKSSNPRDRGESTDTVQDIEVLSVINKETFLDPETGVLQNVIKTEINDENGVKTKLSLESVLNVSIDSSVEKVKGNFISPELSSGKEDENVSLYEDSDMVENSVKVDDDKNEELKLDNENISTDFSKGTLDLDESKASARVSTRKPLVEEIVENSVNDQSPGVVKNELKRGADIGVTDLIQDMGGLAENQKKMDFLSSLTLQSADQTSSEDDDALANKKPKVSFGIKDAEKDENYTGTLKVTLTRKRDGEKKVCPAENEENEKLEYKICPKRVQKLNRNLPLTPVIMSHTECPLSPPHTPLYKIDEDYQDFSFRVLTYIGPPEKEEVAVLDSATEATALAAQLTTEDDTNVKPTRKRIVIPEKSSSFSIHPQRLCDDVCKYCYTKFGSLDTPCHIAQLKSSQLQNIVLKTIMALGTNLTSDSCLCDACYRRVIRMPSEKSEPCKEVKKKKKRVENVACYVPDCRENGIHNVTKKLFHKIKRTLRNKLSVEPEKLASATHFNLCADHYHWVVVALRCFVCEKRQSKQMSEPRAERVLLKAQLESEGIRVQMVDQSSYICKMCKYFCSLLLKKNHMTPSAKDFFDSYKRTLLKRDKSDKDSDELPEPAEVSSVPEPTEDKDKVEEVKEISPIKKKEPVAVERQVPIKLAGEDSIVLHTDLDINKPSKSSGNLERFTTTIQFDTETKKLYQSLLRPYGNQSSFLRHLVILEKYFREGSLVLKEGASSKAQRYINTVNNRIQACNGTVYNAPKPSTPVTPQTSIVNITTKDEPVVAPVSSPLLNQLTITPEVSVVPGQVPLTNVQQPRRYQPIRPAPPLKLMKKAAKLPLPALNPIEKPVEIISSPEISLYNIPAEGNNAVFRGVRNSLALEITPDVSISKTYVPKLKSISNSIPITQTHLSPNTSQSNVVFLLPPSSAPLVSFAQNPFDSRRQSFTTKVNNPMPGVSKSNTPPTTPQFFISNVRSLAPAPMTNVPIRPKKMTPPPPVAKKDGVVIARIPYSKGMERSMPGLTIPTTGPVPNYMLFPRAPRSTSPIISTSIIPPVSLMSGSQSRSLSGSQVANRNDKNAIRALLNARPNLSTSFQGNKSEP